VDIIALSSLNNAHMTIFTQVIELMNEKGLDDVLLTGGGIIPENDIAALNSIGVGKLFGPGTPVQTTIDYLTDWVQNNRR
jgi:methylmalonyl-CoA mutase C-terminal domain/subunit